MTRSTYSKADGFIRVPYEEGVLLAEQLRHYADFLRTAGLTEEAADANFSAYAFEQAKEDPGELRWETRPFFKFKTVHLASSEKGGGRSCIRLSLSGPPVPNRIGCRLRRGGSWGTMSPWRTPERPHNAITTGGRG